MSNQLTREGPYASASVVNTGGTDFNGDLEAGPPPEARPRSAQERRRVSGASRSELGGARSQAVSERPQSTTGTALRVQLRISITPDFEMKHTVALFPTIPLFHPKREACGSFSTICEFEDEI